MRRLDRLTACVLALALALCLAPCAPAEAGWLCGGTRNAGCVWRTPGRAQTTCAGPLLPQRLGCVLRGPACGTSNLSAPPPNASGRAAQAIWRVPQPAAPVASYATPQIPARVPPAQAYQPAQSGADPHGFVAWLNQTRAGYGLPPVSYDPNLESWAQQNNAAQNARGLGHFVMGPARRQNSAMGNYGSIGAMWMASPAHRSALLDPSIRFVGLAGSGNYWTFNAN